MIMNTKRKILIMTDSPRLYTGFANIGRHIAGYLHESGKYEVSYIGWFDHPGNTANLAINDPPYPVYHTMLDKDNKLLRDDSYAYRSFKYIVEHVKPHIVLGISDCWMGLAPVYWDFEDAKSRYFTAIQYCPVDHDPLVRHTKHGGGPTGNFDLDWGNTFKRYDSVIAYCKYGQDEINSVCGSEVCKRYIHHGVDTNIYRPMPRGECVRLKRQLFGLKESDTLVITVARNQPRKLYPAMLQSIKMCLDSNGNDIYYYPHAPLNDPVGWDLVGLCDRLGIKYRMISDKPDRDAHVIFNPDLNVGTGPSDNVLNSYYNAADIGLFIHSGEGWGLPIMECMAAGTPTISTGYSAPLSWAPDASLFVKPAAIMPEPNANGNFMRAVVSPESIHEKLVTLINNPDMSRTLRANGLEVAKSNDWNSKILPQWLDYIDNVELKHVSSNKEVIYLKDADKLTTSTDTTSEDTTSEPLVSIIIPTFSGGDVFRKCIESIRQAGYSNYEIIVVDNGSWQPNDRVYIKYLSETGNKVMKWSKKYCPAKVLNMAAREANGTYLLFMDSDTAAVPGFIQGMLKCFETGKCGAASVTMVHPNGMQFTTGYDYDNRLSFQPSSTGEAICEKHAVSGSCMMTPKTIFDIVGGFDEKYMMYFQDEDYCCKLRERGLSSMCNTTIRITHIGGVTRKYLSKAQYTTDHLYMIHKWWDKYLPDHSKSKEIVAIIKLVTMGDCILVTPLLPKIRARHPDAHIVLYSSVEYGDIFVGNPYIDEVKMVGPIDKADFGNAWSLMAYDAITYNIIATERWDTVYELNQIDYWMEYRRAGTSMCRTYADMIDIELDNEKCMMYPDDNNKKRVDELIASYPGDGPIIVFHTTTGWELKEWTREGFNRLAEHLWNNYKARILVVGAPNEKLNSIYARDIGGLLTLREIYELCTRASLMVGCDSGPLHIAKAANCPILGLFSCTNPMVFGFQDVDNFIALQSDKAGIVNCGFVTCPMEKMAKDAGKVYKRCALTMDTAYVIKAADDLLTRDSNIQEYRKGVDKCTIEFDHDIWEWKTTRLSGKDPDDMCTYGTGRPAQKATVGNSTPVRSK